MSHKYYSEDSETRKKYFDKQFLNKARTYSEFNNITFSGFLGQIKDFETFKQVLSKAWSMDGSLESYYDGMGDEELLEFYNRNVVQNVLNKEEDIVIDQTPDRINQINKKNVEKFMAKYKSKKTGKSRQVIAKKETIKVRGKPVTRYRDSKGRFVGII